MLRLLGAKTYSGARVLACACGSAFSIGICAAQADDAPPASAAMTTPAMSYPLTANASPLTISAGPLGKLYITGAVTGLGLAQTNPILSPSATGNRHETVDISNGQVFIQKTDGLVQYFIQAGGYSLPSVGAPYIASSRTTDNFYGVLPQAFIKIVPNGDFSFEAGKLPTLIGAEYTFTFENTNIERGLLWNQENAVNRGVQANYTKGPVAVAVSWNDGFYSNRYNWLSGVVTYTFDPANVLSFVGMGNLGHTGKSTLATPLAQNNSSIYNVIYTHTVGSWTLQPYIQYTDVASNSQIGISKSASTIGGALFANYAFNPTYNLGGRVEYISTSGNVTDGSPNLMYGPGSKAWSITLTPTYQKEAFFARAEVSFVKANSTTSGLVFGQDGTKTSQARLLVESGFIF